jgi:AbrB family looped-hinge helix DNA binding protein
MGEWAGRNIHFKLSRTGSALLTDSTNNIIYNVHLMCNGNNMAEVYVSKVTSAGQISLPKELRVAMGIEEDYIVIEPFGDALILRKVKTLRDEIFGYFEKEASAKGITKEQLEKAIKKSGRKILKDAYNAER